MSVYQDVIVAARALAAWALTEAAGAAFVPFIGGSNLVGTGAFNYRQAGPAGTDFGLGLQVGSKLTLTFAAVVQPPVTTELWVKMSTVTPATLTFPYYFGASSGNGSGVYIATNGHVHLLYGGRVDTDTGLIWPDTNWHLLQVAANSGGNTTTIAIDGVVRWRASPIVPNAPVPNVMTIGGDSANTTPTALQVAWPAFYAYEMSPGNMASTYQAVTNPAAALPGTVSGGGAAPGAPVDLLTQILKAFTTDLRNTP